MRVLWCCYPALVTFVVIATANHWWFDAYLGAATAAVSRWPRSLLAAPAGRVGVGSVGAPGGA